MSFNDLAWYNLGSVLVCFSLCLPPNLLSLVIIIFRVLWHIFDSLFELVWVKGQTYHTIIYLYQQLLVILSLAYLFCACFSVLCIRLYQRTK